MDISVSRQQKNALGEIVRRQCGEARLHRRARMVLLAAAGETISSIARKVGTARCRVGEWLSRFEEYGVEALGDLPRSGRPPVVTPIERHQVVATACLPPVDFGFQRTLWSHATLRDAVVSRELVRSISARTVGRILDDAEIKPHRVKMWCHSKDPMFQEKMQEIVDLYISPPPGEPVLSIDEKSGLQALSRSRALRPATPGRAGRFEFQYKRNGTRCLFAGTSGP